MSNFNQYFKKQGAKIIVDRFFRGIDAYNKNGDRLTNLKYSFASDPGYPDHRLPHCLLYLLLLLQLRCTGSW